MPKAYLPVLAAGLGFVAATGWAWGANNAAPTTEPADIAELRAEVRDLRAEVRDLKQRQPEAAAFQPDVDQTNAAIEQDARLHGQAGEFSPADIGWTPDRGLDIRTEDGKFDVAPFFLFQTRYAVNYHQATAPQGGTSTNDGFEIRRLQLGVDGYAFDPNLTFRIFWQSSELTDGDLSLLMAWVQYRINGGPWVIGGGQFKDPFYHEQLVGDPVQLAADRTFLDDTLAGGEAFSKGVSLRYDPGTALRGEAAFTSGFNNNNTNFEEYPTNEKSFGLAGRAEYKFFGDWKDYEHFTSLGDHGDLLVAGAGFDWSEAGHTDQVRQAIDAQYNQGPLAVFGAYVGRFTSGLTGGSGDYAYDPGFVLQASYLINERWEPFLRYDYTHLAGSEYKTPTTSTMHEITAGVVYYFFGQRAKVTFDLSYLPNGAPAADAGNDLTANAGHNTVLARGQFQLWL
ncbi:MAG TPA: porin [Tepidisphaeraceae bacterium]|jgi:hypothetical protein|nr:porin [Tepidisphaeraceae bacterium]